MPSGHLQDNGKEVVMSRFHGLAPAMLLGAALSPLGMSVVAAQARPTRSSTPPAASIEASKLQALKWRSVGPATMSGRVTDVAVARTSGAPDALYVGAASGGLWKTTDWGTTWDPVFDSVDGMMSIGDVAVAPSNPNLLWVGTGEANNRQSTSWGDGVYKSTDGGRSWKHMGLKESRHVGRIVIHPNNSDIVYVAALGHLWGSNPERGVFRTMDGGATWEKVLFVDQHTGAVDLVMDPQDPQTLIAAMYQRQRKAWGFNGGGPGSGLWRTNDGGRTWTKLVKGLPTGDKGRIGLDIYRRDGRIVYAVVESDPQRGFAVSAAPITEGQTGGIFRSMDRGDTWEQMNPVNVRPMYFSLIRIDPNDPQRIYYGGTSIMTSHDGGRTFYDPGYGGQGVHPDQHAMWIDPDNSNNLVLGNDGGVFLSYSRGRTWRFVDNLPIGQFYHADVDMRTPYHICGGLQDNGDWCIPSSTRDEKGLSRRDAYLVGGGDGYFVQIDPTDPTTFYVEQGGTSLKRFNYTTGETQDIKPASSDAPTTSGPTRPPGPRGNWSSPVLLSHFDPKTVYAGMNMLFRSRDRGVTWTAISPDLTAKVNRDTLQMMGARVPVNALSRHDGVSSYSTLTTLSESKLDRNVLVIGSDDGQVQITRDGGATWTNVSDRFPGVARFTYVSAVLASRHVAGRVYAAFDGHYDDDYRPYVYVSNDYGQTWRAITRGLPETSVNAIQEHPRSTNLLFLGHEKGVHVSVDAGENWVSLATNMPTVPVDWLIVHPRDNDLIAATHGRAIWILDDLGPLEALAAPSVATSDRALPGRPGEIFNFHHYSGWFWPGHFVAPNPEYGAAISYWLGEAADKVTVQVKDASGAVLRTLDAPGQRGVNRIYWDLRSEPAERPDPKAEYNLVFRPRPVGPSVLPGTYTAVISVAERPDIQVSVVAKGDPMIAISEGDQQRRNAVIQDLYSMQLAGVAATEARRSAADQLALVKKQLDGSSTVSADARRKLAAVLDSLGAVEQQLGRDVGAVNRLAGAIGGFTAIPTVDQMRQVGWAHDDLAASINRLNVVLQKSLPELYAALQTSNVWPSPVRSIALPPRRSGGIR
jgi:photosystem II stability/assembly factor-like uncharacterized protein